MSYCRWSSDDFKCDLYCYEDVNGGWTTHVASNRIVGECPPLEIPPHPPTEAQLREFQKTNNARHAFLDACDRSPIGLPYDGKTFHDYSLEEFRARIVALREIGYQCPDYVLDEIDEEIASPPNVE
jgi:hypothetical protein